MKHCHICGKPATIFLTQISDGKITDLALCKKCAKAKGLFDPRKLMLAEHLFPSELSGEVESFIKKMLESSYVEEADEEVLSSMPDMLNECPACHYTLENFRTTGLLGCPECYKTFGAELVQIDHEVQPDGEPRRAMEAEYMESPALERGRLELLMHEAVSHENYEEAARLRDRIKQLSDNEKKKQ